MRYLGAWALAFVACKDNGGNETGTNTGAPSCDDVVTQPLAEVPSTQWPTGLDQAILDFQDFSGPYTVSNSCGDNLTVKLTAPSFETLVVVTTPWATENLKCGCLNDPQYPDDTEMEAVALLEGFEVFIDSWPDPGVDGQRVIGAGALYAPTSDLEFRACGVKDIDPYLQSAFEQVGAIIRMPQSGGLEGTLTLAPLDGSAVQVCQLTNFNRQL